MATRLSILGERDSHLGLRQVVKSEKSPDDRIWKFVMETPGKQGSFELGSFIHQDIDGTPRHDICVSTMAGCPLSCAMCAIPYSASPYDRSLSADEIEQQIRLAIMERHNYGEKPMRYVVGFMGNGEPFLNIGAWTEVVVRLLANSEARPTSFTVSTTGVRPAAIADLANAEFGRSGIGKIQYSLMSMDPVRRTALIPVGGSLGDCGPHLDEYARKTGQPVKYNIPLIDGMNDSDEEANAFADFINAAPNLRRAKISTFNPFPGVRMVPTPPDRVVQFVNILRAKRVNVKMFFGDVDPKIFASCGQLRARVGNILKP